MKQVFMTFYLGLKCNLRCGYCNLTKDGENSLIINSVNELEKSLEDLKEKNIEPVKLLISGGEPTLFRDEVIEILERYQNKFNLFIISNGLLLDVIKEFVKYNVKFIISYDGHINDRGFDSWEVIKYLYRVNKLEGISLTIGNKNYKYLFETIDEINSTFPDLINKESNINGYRGLELNIARCKESYYDIDYDIFRENIVKLYDKFSNIKLFNLYQNKLCKSFFKIDEDTMCSHFDGTLIENGCYTRIEKEQLNFISQIYKTCVECEALNCLSKSCPISLDASQLNNKNIGIHPYCKMNKIIYDTIKNHQSYKFLESQFENIGLMELILTDNCNLNCKYCFQKNIHSKNIMNEETIDNIIKIIKKYRMNKRTTLSLFGGEPILTSTLKIREYLIKRIEEEELSKFITIAITSNTTSLTEEDLRWLEKCVKILENKVFWQVSLDSTEKYNDINRVNKSGNGTFNMVLKNLEKLNTILKTDHISINSVVNEDNLPGLSEWLLYISKNLLNKSSSFRFRIDQVRNDHMTLNERWMVQEEYNRIINYYNQGLIPHYLVKSVFNLKKDFYNEELINKPDEHSSCGICNNFLTIDTNGDVIPCHGFEDLENKNKYIIHNINTKYTPKNVKEIYEILGCVDKQYSNLKGRYCFECPLKLVCVRCKVAQLQNGEIANTLTYTCQYTHQIMDIYKESNLYELFKPISEDEKLEILSIISSIKEDYPDTIPQEIEEFLLKLNKRIEEKTWFI